MASASPTDTIDLLNKISATEQSIVQQLRLNDHFHNLLSTPTTTIDVKTHVAKCTAEITKSENQRRLFTDATIVKDLIAELTNATSPSSGSPKTTSSVELVIQVCRALGNILYQNEDARDIVGQLNGDAVLINLLDWSLSAGQEGGASDEQLKQFLTVRCGVISNYLLGGEPVAKKAMEHGIMSKIERVVGDCVVDVVANEDVVLNVLLPLTILTETVPDLNFEPPLNRSLVRILGESKNPDIAETCLDLLHYQAENGEFIDFLYMFFISKLTLKNVNIQLKNVNLM